MLLILFTYFTGNHISEESVHYAVSMDGYFHSVPTSMELLISGFKSSAK